MKLTITKKECCEDPTGIWKYSLDKAPKIVVAGLSYNDNPPDTLNGRDGNTSYWLYPRHNGTIVHAYDVSARDGSAKLISSKIFTNTFEALIFIKGIVEHDAFLKKHSLGKYKK